jgi:hypothetical protein
MLNHLGVDGGLASMPVGHQLELSLAILRQPCSADKVRGEYARYPFLAAADPQQLSVLLLGPLNPEADLPEGLVEGGEMAVTFSVG